ncbi:MAG: hypothetical protein OXI45_07665 [Acidobacteriota bacterium]|nr:hypothetical protein [Acidobacteriota bacterium]
MYRPSRFAYLLPAGLLAATLALGSDQPMLGAADGAPPEGVSDEIRAVLGSDGVRATLASGVNLDFWLRSEQPAGANPNPAATFPDLSVGTLVGVVRIDGPWSDYKGNPIEPNVFTMRYGVRPEDGNHMGVSVHLDFVLLVPVAEDMTVDVEWGQDDLNIMSFAATGVGHPAVMSLAPNWEGITEPAIYQDDAEGWALGYPWPGGLTVGFVVEGQGEH